MTVKTIEKKVTELERRLRAIELGLILPQPVSQKPDPVWEQTRGTICELRGGLPPRSSLTKNTKDFKGVKGLKLRTTV